MEEAKEATDSRSSSVRRGLEILDRVEAGGSWPSHITELKQSGYPLEAYAQGLGDGVSPWFGGSARIPYVYVGFIARRTKDGKHTELHFRVYHPSGQIYRTDDLGKLLDFADNFGLGLVETVGQTGDLVIPVQAEHADRAVDEIRALGTDLGGTGDTFRDTAVCVGPALCEYALFDTLAARDHYFQLPAVYEKLSSQLFPFKIKLKASGCPMDCARAVQRSDFAFVGTWQGAPSVDPEALRVKTEAGEVDPARLAAECPGHAIGWDAASRSLSIDGAKCQKSMNCIRAAFPAIRPGTDRKVAFLVGANAKGRYGPKMAKPVALLDDPAEAGEFMIRLIDYWADRAPHKDRLGDLLVKEGFEHLKVEFKDALTVEESGTPASASRIVTSAVLSDADRDRYAAWAESIAKEYDG